MGFIAIQGVKFVEYSAVLPDGTFLKVISGITMVVSIMIVPFLIR